MGFPLRNFARFGAFVSLVMLAVMPAQARSVYNQNERNALGGLHDSPIRSAPVRQPKFKNAQVTNTVLTVTNTSNSSVVTYLTLGQGVNGCAGNPNQFSVTTSTGANVPITVMSNNATGFFTIARGSTVTLAGLATACINGELTFGSIPTCPCGSTSPNPNQPCPAIGAPSTLPNGVNGFEVTLNPPTGQEGLDITGVNGTNAQIQGNFSGGPNWNDGPSNSNVTQIQNASLDIAGNTENNCNLVGVFPFNATNCINVAGTAPCGDTICLDTSAICQLQRAGSGGTVAVTYFGRL